ncbi:MAG TPA: class I SAM-dependent methyltransferase [Candidatus Acidoferrum sp.]|nr:class I SAM-dependent methyltransferase [Candidatus Acidoferrum sp.]
MPCLPHDVNQTIESAWKRASLVPGFLVENEARFLGTLAACTPAQGAIVEIGSFKGKSTVMLGTVAAYYRLGPVVAIDPHAGLSYLGPDVKNHLDPTFTEFLANIQSAGVAEIVEVHRTFSREVAKDWHRSIRLLWIDGDHSYRGCKEDFDLFAPFLADGAVVAFHDSLNAFEGPIRVFVEDILRSDRFGPSGFVHSIAWSQFRPKDGANFREQRKKLERRGSRLLPYVANDASPSGLRKTAYKLHRSLVPRKHISSAHWAALLGKIDS